jgi:hypothetical protein
MACRMLSSLLFTNSRAPRAVPLTGYDDFFQAKKVGISQRIADEALGVRHGIGNATWTGTPRIISWEPMATVYDNFLSEDECDYILELARPRMEPAMLVSNDVKHKKSRSRTSHGAFFDSFQNPTLAMITDRIGHVARVPPGGVLSKVAKLASLCIV